MRTLIPICAVACAAAGTGACAAGTPWVDALLAFPYPADAASGAPRLHLLRQDYESLERSRSVIGTPLCIGSRRFGHGLGTHAVSRIRIDADEPIEAFAAWVGVDSNERTSGGQGSVVFVVSAGDRELYRSPVMRGGDEAVRVELAVPGVTALDLVVEDAGDGPSCDHADWAEAIVTLRGGAQHALHALPVTPLRPPRYPFSFLYGGKTSDALLPEWTCNRASTRRADGGERSTTAWDDPATGLRFSLECDRFSGFEAVEWRLFFENRGADDSLLIENVQSLDAVFGPESAAVGAVRLLRTNGAPSNPTDFEPSSAVVKSAGPQTLSGGGGRSSNRDFPFFTLETPGGSFAVAVAWSGQWIAHVDSHADPSARVKVGLETTHFRLHPGERVRLPGALVFHEGLDATETHARFRQLIYRHYTPNRNGKRPLPTLFCNTCFTRGGGWLNECNAENQISLINAYAPLGLEALLTDAGWFEGGWPAGAGNWTPRKDAYPSGMGPVAEAAQRQGMTYGLWFEPERVVANTSLHRDHPEWCLAAGEGPQGTYLADFGLPEVQDHFFSIVKGFMDLPGFRVYRQDFNMDPLPYWRFNDAPDRQGITEMKYIEGLYAYWDRIAGTWPDSLREECASGGRRIDLETVRRMHIHQDSDYWFHDDVDQAQIWGLSQYLPSNVFVGHVAALDDYAFHSVMATSLCLGWIADAPDFDRERAGELVDRYLTIRHLLVGAWYPLLPYTREPREWMASQYHRPDLDEGIILAFRHAESPYSTAEVALRVLRPESTYELAAVCEGTTTQATGRELMDRLLLTLPHPRSTELIRYRALPGSGLDQ